MKFYMDLLDSSLQHLQWYKEVFGEDYYLDLQRHQMEEEDLQTDGLNQESWLSSAISRLH